MANSATAVWSIKIKMVKTFLKGWAQNLRGHNKKYKRLLEEQLLKLEKLEEENLLPAPLPDRKTFIQSELLRILSEEELYWHKRSNVRWLLEGDNNTNFFHRVENGKRRKNTIFNLSHNNTIIEGDEKILEHATQYYKKSF